LKALRTKITEKDAETACYKSLVCLSKENFDQLQLLLQSSTEDNVLNQEVDQKLENTQEFINEYSKYCGISKNIIKSKLDPLLN
jgi:hypothetical protein